MLDDINIIFRLADLIFGRHLLISFDNTFTNLVSLSGCFSLVYTELTSCQCKCYYCLIFKLDFLSVCAYKVLWKIL